MSKIITMHMVVMGGIIGGAGLKFIPAHLLYLCRQMTRDNRGD